MMMMIVRLKLMKTIITNALSRGDGGEATGADASDGGHLPHHTHRVQCQGDHDHDDNVDDDVGEDDDVIYLITPTESSVKLVIIIMEMIIQRWKSLLLLLIDMKMKLCHLKM